MASHLPDPEPVTPTPTPYDSSFPTWFLTHQAQLGDMQLASQNSADITGRAQQIVREIPPTEYDQQRDDHFMTSYYYDGDRYWQVIEHIRPNPDKMRTLGFAERHRVDL